MIPRRTAIDGIESLQSEQDLVDIWRIKNPKQEVTLGVKIPKQFSVD